MNEIFLSASIPEVDRGHYHESADPFLIQAAVRELIITVLGRRRLVWGGHPAITPMVWSVCADLGVNYADAVVLYQSKFFEIDFPVENEAFPNVIHTESLNGNREQSLSLMRTQMLSRPIDAAVFIGGMEGIFEELRIFQMLHPSGTVLPVRAPGGAAREIDLHGKSTPVPLDTINFVDLYTSVLGVRSDEPRNLQRELPN